MKKTALLLVCLLTFSLVSCNSMETPTFPNVENFASCLYRDMGENMTAIYLEPISGDTAYALGVNTDYFEKYVEEAVCLRRVIDTDGKILYAMKLKEKKDACRFAETVYENYEFPPCDVADKMAVAAENEYVILFKSDAGDVNKTVESFLRMMGGHLRFEREKINKG